jgi:uncharacterized protein involved in outer membrane biogenesis
MSRTLKWFGVVIVALTLPIAGVVVFVFLFLDANHLRGTIARLITEKTGRQLAINGDLLWKLDWPQVRLHAFDVTFANPPCAREKQMIAAPAVELSVDLPLFLRGRLFLSEVELDRPVVFFERSADGRKNWLLDQEQQDEDARISIGRLTLDNGRVGYDDPSHETSIVAEISTGHTGPAPAQAGTADPGIVFSAKGRYLGLPLTASGSGGQCSGCRASARRIRWPSLQPSVQRRSGRKAPSPA